MIKRAPENVSHAGRKAPDRARASCVCYVNLTGEGAYWGRGEVGGGDGNKNTGTRP